MSRIGSSMIQWAAWSWLVVYIFAGSVPITCELKVLDNSTRNVAITYTIASMTGGLLARCAQLDERFATASVRSTEHEDRLHWTRAVRLDAAACR